MGSIYFCFALDCYMHSLHCNDSTQLALHTEERFDNPLLTTARSWLRIKTQGWDFAHRFSERIALFLQKIEQMSDLLKKSSDLLIRSFFGERPE